MLSLLSMVLVIVLFVVQILFCLSFYKTLCTVPSQHHIVPAWITWLMLIPYINIIFSWLMLPFALPRAIKSAYPSDVQLQAKANKLFIFGLSLAILQLFAFFIPPIGIVALVVFIIYWCLLPGTRHALAAIH